MNTRTALCLVLLSLSTTSAIAHHVEKSGPPAAPAASAPTVQVSGFVSETTIDNRVAGTSSRLLVLHGDNGARSVLLGAGASPLRAGASYVLTGRASGSALFVDSSRMTSPSDMRATQLAASPQFAVDGTLRLGHADNFDGAPSEFFYAIVGNDAQYRVSGAMLADGLVNGMTGHVTGRVAHDGELVADRIVIVAPAAALAKAGPAAEPLTTSYIVLPVKFPTNAAAPFTYNADPFTVASINSVVFGATNSVGHYYAEASYGQQLISGIVADNGAAGWLLAERAVPTTCDINVIATAAENAATARGYNLASYAGRIYVFTNNVPGCGWAGLAYVGWPRSYIKQTTSLLVIGHEVGHNFGMLHAASLDCGANVVGGTCTSAEYGDPFDIMGNNRAMHPNAAQKFDLGWIAPGTVKTHTAGRATYTLTPIESAGGATYAVKIPAATNRTYWLEYRQPIGYDAALSSFPNNGAQFRVAAPFESICSGCADDTEFLDMTPATSPFTDGTLVAGQSYTDALYGLMVNIAAATPSALTVEVVALGDTPRPDLDFSGGTDLVWRNPVTGQVALWLMNGLAAGSAATVLSDPNWTVTGTGDFNADGKSDLLWRNSATGQTAIWLMNGSTVLGFGVIHADPNWVATHTGDLNGDGKSDLVWRNNSTGQTAVWLMNGLAASSTSIIYTSAAWSVAKVGDFNGDARSDLLWRNGSTGQTAVWLMNGTAATGTAAVMSDANWEVRYVADLNGDGKSDLVWRNNSTGQTAVWLMNGLASSATAALTATASWSVVATADVNGDGKADLVWRNGSTGQTAVWLMNGVAATGSGVLSSDANWLVVQAGDFNADGKVDLLWRNGATGQSSVWLMNGMSASAAATLPASAPWATVALP